MIVVAEVALKAFAAPAVSVALELIVVAPVYVFDPRRVVVEACVGLPVVIKKDEDPEILEIPPPLLVVTLVNDPFVIKPPLRVRLFID